MTECEESDWTYEDEQAWQEYCEMMQNDLREIENIGRWLHVQAIKQSLKDRGWYRGGED